MFEQMNPVFGRPCGATKRGASAATLALALLTGASSWALATAALAQRAAATPTAPAPAEAEAVIVTGSPSPVPGLTPDRQLSPEEKRDIVAYVRESAETPSYGGYGLGGFGPAPEGMAMWIIGMVAAIGVAMWIGARA